MSAVAAAAAAPSVRPSVLSLYFSLSPSSPPECAPPSRESDAPLSSSPPGFLLYSLKDPPAAEGGRC